MGSEDSLHLLKGIFVQEWSREARFDHGQFGTETFPIYVPP